MNNWKKIFSFALPSTLIGLLDFFIVLIDIFWVNFYENDLNMISGIRLSISMQFLLEGLTVGVLSAFLIYIVQNLGANQIEDAAIGVRTSLTITLLLGILVAGLGLTFKSAIINLFNAEGAILTHAEQYFAIIIGGYFFILLNTYLMMLARYFQTLSLVYKSMVITVVTCIIFTPIVVNVFPQLELSIIEITAYGTVVSNLISSIYLLFMIYGKDVLQLNMNLKALMPTINRNVMKSIRTFIASQMFSGVLFNCSTFLYMYLIARYPSEALNIYSLGSYIFMFFGLFAQNFAATIIPLVGELKGKGDLAGIQDLIKKYVTIAVAYAALSALFLIGGKESIMRMLDISTAEYYYMNQFLMMYIIPWSLSCIYFIFIFVLTGSGDSFGGMALTISNMYVAVILSFLIVPQFFADEVIGVFAALSTIQVSSFIITSLYFLAGKWKKARSLVNEQHA